MSEGSKILIVNGDPSSAQRLVKALSGMKAREYASLGTELATSLTDALKALKSTQPKVIFAALDLSDSTGLNTILALRAVSGHSPIIALIADEDNATGAAALGSGAQDYLYLSETRGDVIERAIIRAVSRQKVEEEREDTGWRSGIGETALGIRHEINNPLAALMLNLEMLREGGHEDADELLEGIEIAAKRIAAVVRRLERLRTPQRIPAIGDEAMVDLSGGDSGSKRSERKEERAAGTPSGDGSTILLVDDEESVRAIVTKILGRHGHSVLEAEHGADALRLAASYEGKIDLLITDMYMPGLRGPEIFEKLQPSRPGMRVLFMSGYGDEDVARSGVAPDSSFLRKPFTVQELSEAVQKALGAAPQP